MNWWQCQTQRLKPHGLTEVGPSGRVAAFLLTYCFIGFAHLQLGASPAWGLEIGSQNAEPNTLTIDQANADVEQTRDLVERHFPNLGLYEDADVLLAAFDGLIAEFSAAEDDAIELSHFARELQKVVVRLGDGHTCLRPQAGKSFPLTLTTLEDAVVLEASIDGFGPWSQVLEVNGQPIHKLLDAIGELTCVDGADSSGARRIAANDFSEQFALLHQQTDVIRFKLVDNENRFKTIRIVDGLVFDEGVTGESEDDIVVGQILSWQKPKEAPPMLSMPAEKVAYLKINTFMIDGGAFEREISEIFERISNQGVEDLILDLRGNHGGLIRNASLTLSYLMQRQHFFPQFLHVTQNGFRKKDMSPGRGATGEDKRELEKMRLLVNEKIDLYSNHESGLPAAPRGRFVATKSVEWGSEIFDQNLHVLIDQTTASAAAMLVKQLVLFRPTTFYGSLMTGSPGRGCMKSEIPFVLKHSQLNLDLAWLCYLLDEDIVRRTKQGSDQEDENQSAAAPEVAEAAATKIGLVDYWRTNPQMTPQFETGVLLSDYRVGEDTVVNQVLKRIAGRNRPPLPRQKPVLQEQSEAGQGGIGQTAD